MKVCPDCQKTYDDDADLCEDDGAALLEAPDSLEENPELAQVVQVAPDDHTSVIDLEAMEDKLRARQAERSQEQRALAQEIERREDLQDPERTGTAYTGESNSRAAALEALDERTMQTRFARSSEGTLKGLAGDDMPVSTTPKKIALIALAFIALGGALLVGYFLWARQAPLQITSVPSKATVRIDGATIGQTPLLKKIIKGSHTVEVELEGHAPFKEVVILSGAGTSIAAQLEALNAVNEDKKPVAPKTQKDKVDDNQAAEIEKALVQKEIDRVQSLIGAGHFDEAFEAIKNLVKAHPDNPRIDLLFDTLASARSSTTKNEKTANAGTKKATKAERKTMAASKYAEGERLYRSKNFSEAKGALKESLKLNSRASAPHRILARIYLAEQKSDRVRYHLKRFLRLGGKDRDGAVRRWLEDHPAQ